MSDIPPLDLDPGRDSVRQGQEFITGVHQKMSQLVQEFADGAINRTQFHELYNRYQRQIVAVAQLIAESDPTMWRSAVADSGNTQHIKKQLAAKAVGMAVFHSPTGQPIQAFGAFRVAHERIGPVLESYRAAAAEGFQAGMRSTELDDRRWLCFVPGEFTTLIALFSLEPSENQLATLDRLHQDFERANYRALEGGRPDPDALAYPFYAFVHSQDTPPDQT